MEIIYSLSWWEEEEEHINRAFPKAKVNNQPGDDPYDDICGAYGWRKCAAQDKTGNCRWNDEGRLTRGQCLRAISGLSQRLDSLAVCEMSHTGN